MKIILIDDHGETRELTDDGNTVVEMAKEGIFWPCGCCGNVCFVEDVVDDHCKYCHDENIG